MDLVLQRIDLSLVRKSAAWIESLADIAPIMESCSAGECRSRYLDYAMRLIEGLSYSSVAWRPSKVILLPIAAVLMLLYSTIHPARAYGGPKPRGPHKPLTCRRPLNRGPPVSRVSVP